jgi:hypothetical protein
MTLLRFALVATVLLIATGCGRQPPNPSTTTFLAPLHSIAIHRPLRLDDVRQSEAAFSTDARTTTTTFLDPVWTGIDSLGDVLCYDKRGFIDEREQGGLGQLDENVHVRIYGSPSPDLTHTSYVNVLTDDGYVGQICTSDLEIIPK